MLNSQRVTLFIQESNYLICNHDCNDIFRTRWSRFAIVAPMTNSSVSQFTGDSFGKVTNYLEPS